VGWRGGGLGVGGLLCTYQSDTLVRGVSAFHIIVSAGATSCATRGMLTYVSAILMGWSNAYIVPVLAIPGSPCLHRDQYELTAEGQRVAEHLLGAAGALQQQASAAVHALVPVASGSSCEQAAASGNAAPALTNCISRAEPQLLQPAGLPQYQAAAGLWESAAAGMKAKQHSDHSAEAVAGQQGMHAVVHQQQELPQPHAGPDDAVVVLGSESDSNEADCDSHSKGSTISATLHQQCKRPAAPSAAAALPSSSSSSSSRLPVLPGLPPLPGPASELLLLVDSRERVKDSDPNFIALRLHGIHRQRLGQGQQQQLTQQNTEQPPQQPPQQLPQQGCHDVQPGIAACSVLAVGVETYELPLGDYMWVAAVPAGCAAAGRVDGGSGGGTGGCAGQCQLEQCYAVGGVVERKTIQVGGGGLRWQLAAGCWHESCGGGLLMWCGSGCSPWLQLSQPHWGPPSFQHPTSLPPE
jgi:hypothetical protein